MYTRASRALGAGSRGRLRRDARAGAAEPRGREGPAVPARRGRRFSPGRRGALRGDRAPRAVDRLEGGGIPIDWEIGTLKAGESLS